LNGLKAYVGWTETGRGEVAGVQWARMRGAMSRWAELGFGNLRCGLDFEFFIFLTDVAKIVTVSGHVEAEVLYIMIFFLEREVICQVVDSRKQNV
jgi:hypothetical protein